MDVPVTKNFPSKHPFCHVQEEFALGRPGLLHFGDELGLDRAPPHILLLRRFPIRVDPVDQSLQDVELHAGLAPKEPRFLLQESQGRKLSVNVEAASVLSQLRDNPFPALRKRLEYSKIASNTSWKLSRLVSIDGVW